MTTPSLVAPVPTPTCPTCDGRGHFKTRFKRVTVACWDCEGRVNDRGQAPGAASAPIEDLTPAALPLFTPAPVLRRKPSEMTLERARWIYGHRIDAEGRTDVIGAYLLAAGVPAQELRECAHLWAWSAWARSVDRIGAQCVQANRLAQQWSLRASPAEAQMRETSERNAAQLEQQLITLLASKGVSLSITGAMAPVH